MTNEILDNAISLNRLLWIMDDKSLNRLFAITQAHLRLVKEHGCKYAHLDRRQAIRAEIERLRAERDCLLKSFKQEGVK